MLLDDKRRQSPFVLKESTHLYSTRPDEDEGWRQRVESTSEYIDIKHSKDKDWVQRLLSSYVEEEIQIRVNSQKTIVLPVKLKALADAIEESMYILELEDDFDDEGSCGYEFTTWERTVDFLVNYSKWALDAYRVVVGCPEIYHGPDGSIDLLWKNPTYKLLINVPKEIDSPASFYGDDYDMDVIKGTFDPAKCNRGLLLLLLKLV